MKQGRVCAGAAKPVAAVKFKNLDRSTGNGQNLIGETIEKPAQGLKT
jgi:hypothetical protein